MADIADPVVWSTLIQTAVLTLTLVIFILTFRSQNQAIREQAYQKVLDDYSDAINLAEASEDSADKAIRLTRAAQRGAGR